MAIRDAVGTWQWQDLIGATILRTIVDFDMLPTFTVTTGTSVGSWIAHFGIFVATLDTPTASVWSPNTPYGSFMWRGGGSGFYRKEAVTDGGGGIVVHDNGRRVHVDTIQKRIIRENDRLYRANSVFLTGAATQLDYGYTGRVLVALP